MKDDSAPGGGFGAIIIRLNVVEVEWLKFVTRMFRMFRSVPNIRARDRVGLSASQRSDQARWGGEP